MPGFRFLVIDDNFFNIQMLWDLILVSMPNAEIIDSLSGETGIKIVKKNLETPLARDFDYLFLDINMPMMNGFSTLKKLDWVYAQFKKKWPPAFAVTAQVCTDLPRVVWQYIHRGHN